MILGVQMLRKGHVGISLLVAAPLFGVTLSHGFISEAVVLVGAIVMGGGVPDIDSKLSVVKHRGFLHTVWFAVIFGVVTAGITYLVLMLIYGQTDVAQQVGNAESIVWFTLLAGFGGMVGVISHLLGDMITPWGVTPLEPVDDRKFRVEVVKAANSTANTVFMLSGVAAMFVAGAYGGRLLVTAGI